MRLHGKEYGRRLQGFSHFTLVLISTIHGMSREMVYKSHDITTDSDLTEEQVIEKLLELIRSCPDCSPYVTYSEALKKVCEALAEGYFASLYKIVERDADLVFVDEDKCISGERDIFNFLVQEIKEHRYESRQKTITCDILRVAEGERYGVGERCILLTYHLKDGTRENHIIKVHFANSKIYKLEFFNPYGPLRLVDEQTFNEK